MVMGAPRDLAREEQAIHVPGGVHQVGLHHDAQVRPDLELGMGEQLLEQVVGDAVELAALQVHVEEDVLPLGQEEERQHLLLEPGHAARGVHRIQAAVQGGELEGDVGDGDGPQMVVAEDRVGLPAGDLVGQVFDEIPVTIEIGLALLLGQGGLAQEIGGEADALAVQLAQLRDGLGGVMARG